MARTPKPDRKFGKTFHRNNPKADERVGRTAAAARMLRKCEVPSTWPLIPPASCPMKPLLQTSEKGMKDLLANMPNRIILRKPSDQDLALFARLFRDNG